MKPIRHFTILTLSSLAASFLFPGLTGCSLLNREDPFIAKMNERIYAEEEGNLSKALKRTTEAMVIAQARANQNPENTDIQVDLLQSCYRMSSILSDMGQFDKALSYCNACQEIASNLKTENPDYATVPLLGRAKIYTAQGNVKQALPNIKKAVHIIVKTASRDKENNGEKIENTYSLLGSAYLEAEQPGQALSIFQKNLALQQKRTANDNPYTPNPGNDKSIHCNNVVYIDTQADLCNTYNDMGNAYLALGNVHQAAICFQHGTELVRFFREDPDNAFLQTAARDSYNGLGKSYLASKQPEKALQAYEAGLSISNYLVQSPWADWSWRPYRDLVLSLVHVGTTHLAMKNKEKARSAFEESLSISHKLHNKYPENPKFSKMIELSNRLLEKLDAKD